MVRRYERQNIVFPKDENGYTSASNSYVESVDLFTFAIYAGNNNIFTVTKNGKPKTVYIEDCGADYVYKLAKAKIKAKNGARGLFDYIDKALFENFAACNAWKILDYIIDEMRPAQI